MGEAEEEGGRLAGEGLFGDRLAILRHELERYAERAAGNVVLGAGHFQRQPAEKSRDKGDGNPEYEAQGLHGGPSEAMTAGIAGFIVFRRVPRKRANCRNEGKGVRLAGL